MTIIDGSQSPSDGAMSAVALGVATMHDPQFMIPERPHVVPGVCLVWTAEGLLIEGVTKRKILRGTSARTVLPRLFPLLDGTRSWADLGSILKLSPSEMRSVLALLFSCGALIDGTIDPDDALRPQTAYLARAIDATRVNSSMDETRTRLLGRRLFVVGPESATAQVFRELAPLGVVRADSLGDADFALLFSSAGDEDELAKLASAIHDSGIPALLAGAASKGVFVGPLVSTGYGACLACCLADILLAPIPPGAARTLASLAAVEIVQLMARVGTAASVKGHVVVDSGSATSVMVIPVRPGCPVCGLRDARLTDPPIAYEFEQSVEFPPRRFVNPRDHQNHFEPSNVALQFDPSPRPELSRLQLVTRSFKDELPQGDQVDLTRLGQLLLATFGLKSTTLDGRGRVRRWAPTGGNLGSPHGYVIGRTVIDLPAGLYRYVPAEHSLVVVSDAVPTELAGVSDAEIIVTGSILKVAKKYRTFSYRIVHLDTGAALANFAVAASRYGVPIMNARNWNEQALFSAFGIAAYGEIVTARLLVGESR